MTSLVLSNRIISAIRGAIVADAATMGLHWIYDPAELHRRAGTSAATPEFLTPPQPNFYNSNDFPRHYEAGMSSPYGELLVHTTQHVASVGTNLSGETASKALYSWATSFGGRPDSALKKFVENYKAGKSWTECGADDHQAMMYAKVVPVTCLYAGKPELQEKLTEVIRVHQNNDMAVAFGLAASAWIQLFPICMPRYTTPIARSSSISFSFYGPINSSVMICSRRLAYQPAIHRSWVSWSSLIQQSAASNSWMAFSIVSEYQARPFSKQAKQKTKRTKPKRSKRKSQSRPPPPKKFTKASKPPKATLHPTSSSSKSNNSMTYLPPAMLLPTASKFVYVASAAISGDDDDDSEEDSMDPRSLFADVVDGSALEPFLGMSFEYFPPKSFQHELPNATKSHFKIPEVAFLGRSNVGKSSLINALIQRDLARCSKHPGRTQQPYYYGVVPDAILSSPTARNKNGELNPLTSSQGFLVDLPGYGYAQAPDKAVGDWQQHTQEFLMARRDAGTLHRLFLLIDARRGLNDTGGSTALDQTVMRWLDEHDIPYSVVITKADCVGTPQLVKVTNEVCLRYQQQHQQEEELWIEQQQYIIGRDDDNDEIELESAGWMGPIVHITSSKKGDGIKELCSTVEAELSAVEY